MSPNKCRIRAARRVVVCLVLAMLWVVAGGLTASSAQEAEDAEHEDAEAEEVDPAQAEADEQLRLGAEVYSQTCQSCHQPGGVGLGDQFPPLVDNPNVTEASYILEVIDGGLQGEIEVNGETYNGVMPSFSTLPDGDAEAVAAYILGGFQAPATDIAEFEAAGPNANSELPTFSGVTAWLAYLIAIGLGAVALMPRLASANNRLDFPWLDAWLKTIVIVLAVFFFVVYLPDFILKTTAVSQLSRFARDFIGTAVWGIGVVTILGGLWWAHREKRV